MLPPPFDAGSVDFGAAFQTSNAYLRTAVDQAISVLAQNGTLDKLARQAGLPLFTTP